MDEDAVTSAPGVRVENIRVIEVECSAAKDGNFVVFINLGNEIDSFRRS